MSLVLNMRDYTKGMTISFRLSQLDRIDKAVQMLKERSRSDFVRDAVEEKLQQVEKTYESEKSE